MSYINETKGKDHEQKIQGYEFKLWVPRIISIAAGVLFCILGIGVIVACVSQKSYEPLGFGIPILLFGPLFVLMGIYLKKIFRKTIERGKQNIAPVTRVAFEEEELEVTVPFNRQKSGRYGYGEVGVTEYPEVWVVELSNGQWYTLNKSGMVEGSAEDLSAFLAKKLKERYVAGAETL